MHTILKPFSSSLSRKVRITLGKILQTITAFLGALSEGSAFVCTFVSCVTLLSAAAAAQFTTRCNYLLIVKLENSATKIRMGHLPFFVSADIQLIFFINNTDVTE